MKLLAIILAAVFLPGCAFHLGTDGMNAVLAGSFYSHTDAQSDANVCNEDEKDLGDSRWTTHAARTWGTSGIEGRITSDSEIISITGKGISRNLAGVLGEDVIDKIAHRVACALQPAQPGCLGD